MERDQVLLAKGYEQWFSKNGYQTDDKPCFEMYPEEPKDGYLIVDICVPVKQL
ncbi:MAG: GyrI-like domain-containing protein [Balneola sp.]